MVQHLRDSGRRIVNLRSFLGAKGVGSQPGLNQTLSQKEDRERERREGEALGRQAQNVWVTALKELAPIYPQV